MTAGVLARAARQERLPDLDWALLGAAVALAVLGLVMVASASLHLGDRLGHPFHYVVRHALALGVGVALALGLGRLPLEAWERRSTTLYFIGLVLLVIVLLPGVGHEANGAVRWIRIGSFNVQTSEFMKLFMVVYLAGYLVRRQQEVTHSVWAFVRPMLLLLLAAGLIMLQPDFGTTFVLLATAMGMMFLGGVALWQFGVLLAPSRLARVATFLDPFSKPTTEGYQLSQALIAFGRGEWAGVGLGNGIQKQFYLPEAHTDFIMAVVGEEFGLLGTVAVAALFAVIFWRAFANGMAAERAGNRFAAFASYGCGLWIGLQACINIGVNVGRLPTKGLTLPLMSYGSNSVIVTCLAVGLMLRVHHEYGRTADARRERRSWRRA
jgi:cell division protein FtsW